jgi:hypothetical protein
MMDIKAQRQKVNVQSSNIQPKSIGDIAPPAQALLLLQKLKDIASTEKASIKTP